MKLHFVSRDYGVPLAFRAVRDRAIVTVHISDSLAGDNMFHLTTLPMPPSKGDAVIVDGSGWGKLVSELEAEGHRVLFGGAWAELMSLKPKYNEMVLAKSGLPVAQRVTTPYELLLGGWFEDGKLAAPYYGGILRNRLLAGDIGALSGIIAAELCPLPQGSPLIDEWLTPLEESLADVPYRGLLSLYLTPVPNGLAAVRVVAGIQPLIIECLSEMTPGGFTALIQPGAKEGGGDCGVALSLTLPPWPYGLASGEPRQYIELDDGQARHFWPIDIAEDETGLYYAGGLGIVGTVTARGKPMALGDENGSAWFRQAGGRARAMIPRLGIPMVQYRNDIGYKTLADMEPLL